MCALGPDGAVLQGVPLVSPRVHGWMLRRMWRVQGQWTFLRGALATVDRPVFGWVGRFFWHGIAHDHVAHHFFVGVPFYNLPEVTEAIKPVLGEYYYYDSTPTLYALWRSFTQCKFIESTGDIVFFKNMRGEVVRELECSAGSLARKENAVDLAVDDAAAGGERVGNIHEELEDVRDEEGA
ncbi:hypothetical protein EVJ58_g7675 [Rhodofomes roseus]|uniref:Fatty acid desaturase domain-containing protein n=1 Tax=Rhodofomes roseus TaxID=34475 RepID=A0A4Y9Y384_9APHY|nr:hypothetical protein EVJ58_g7675 [Rhodofomes roseus]